MEFSSSEMVGLYHSFNSVTSSHHDDFGYSNQGQYDGSVYAKVRAEWYG